MTEGPITSTFVSQVVPLGFADAAEGADRLSATVLAAGRVRLRIGKRIGDGLAGAVWYEGVLYSGTPLLPRVRVDVVVSPWSAGRSEIGLRPLGRIGRADSLRTRRFLDAAWTILPELTDELAAGHAAGAVPPAAVRVAASAA